MAGPAAGTAPPPGVRIRVPFGRRQEIGVLLEVRADSPLARDKLRPISEIIDHQPVLTPDLLALLRWAQNYYHHPPGEVMAAALPVLLRQGEPAEPHYPPLWRLTEAGLQALAQAEFGRAPRQRELAELLAEHRAGLSAERLRTLLPGYTASARALREKGWLEQVAGGADPGGPESTPPASQQSALPQPNPAQLAAINAVTESFGRFATFLLDGVTGSGKTEVYLRIVAAALAAGRQALVLVPEIGLTPQLLARFRRRVGGPLAVLHSGLTNRERLNAWLLAGAGSAGVVIGTRSAVFTPLARPAVIIIDEEHDGSFKQQEGFRYSARDLALVRGKQAGIPVLLGSATPALETLYNAAAGRSRYRTLALPQRVGGAVPPTLQLLDVRRQPMEAGLSEPLLAAIQTHLDAGSQALLFLNRRGFAPTLICHECGWLGQCGQCDARLTLHLNRRRLICHHCSTEQRLPASCPGCGSVDLRALGQGTERVEGILEQRFGRYGIARIDRDSTRRKGSLQRLLADVNAGRRRLLIGTQMLAKGHHFPDVTLVGIVDADQGLFGTDYRAGERMAQQVVQVAGRAGRAEKPGLVLIQTHHPGHPLLQTLVRQGYAAFAAAALQERREVRLPPFTCQALLRADAARPEPPQVFLNDAAALARPAAAELGLELLGPVPAPMERRAGRYRAQLLLQGPTRAALHRLLGNWVRDLGGLKSARRVRWSLDVDPLDLL